MKTAIIISPDNIVPAIYMEATADALLAKLRQVVFAPALPDVAAARDWLAELPQPSGWFDSAEDARAHVAAFRRPVIDMTPDQIKAAREALGLTRGELAKALGMGGTSHTRFKEMEKFETGQRRLGIEATHRLRAMLAERGLG